MLFQTKSKLIKKQHKIEFALKQKCFMGPAARFFRILVMYSVKKNHSILSLPRQKYRSKQFNRYLV